MEFARSKEGSSEASEEGARTGWEERDEAKEASSETTWLSWEEEHEGSEALGWQAEFGFDEKP